MANSTLAALTAVATPAPTDAVYVEQAGVAKKATIGQYAVLNNFAATRIPTTTDDSTAGYAAGSRWMWAANGLMWNCRDATASAAVWVLMDASDTGGTYISGNWYFPFGAAALGGGAQSVANTLRFTLGVIKSRVTIASLGARVTTVGSTNAQFALYANNPATYRPTGAALGNTASIANNGLGNISQTFLSGSGSNVTVEAGNYWFASCQNDSTAVLQSHNASGNLAAMVMGSATLNTLLSATSSNQLDLSFAGTFGTWPDMTANTCVEDTTAKTPVMFFKVA